MLQLQGFLLKKFFFFFLLLVWLVTMELKAWAEICLRIVGYRFWRAFTSLISCQKVCINTLRTYWFISRNQCLCHLLWFDTERHRSS